MSLKSKGFFIVGEFIIFFLRVEAMFQKYKEETKKIDANLKGFKIQAKKDEKQLRAELKEMRYFHRMRLNPHVL